MPPLTHLVLVVKDGILEQVPPPCGGGEGLAEILYLAHLQKCLTHYDLGNFYDWARPCVLSVVCGCSPL